MLLWMKYLTSSINSLDDHVAHALQAMVSKKTENKEKALPLCKHKLNLNMYLVRAISAIEKQHTLNREPSGMWGEEEDLKLPLLRKNSKLNKAGMNLDEMKD
jgi:hypothetical protein